MSMHHADDKRVVRNEHESAERNRMSCGWSDDAMATLGPHCMGDTTRSNPLAMNGISTVLDTSPARARSSLQKRMFYDWSSASRERETTMNSRSRKTRTIAFSTNYSKTFYHNHRSNMKRRYSPSPYIQITSPFPNNTPTVHDCHGSQRDFSDQNLTALGNLQFRLFSMHLYPSMIAQGCRLDRETSLVRHVLRYECRGRPTRAEYPKSSRTIRLRNELSSSFHWSLCIPSGSRRVL